MATGVDLGFSLELEGHSGLETDASAIPFPGVRVASEGLAEAVAATKDELPALAPPTSRASSASRALRSVAKKHSFPRWIYFALGGVAALVLAAVLVLPLLRRAPDADAVLQPFQLELAKDNASAYPRGAEELIRVAATFKEGGDKLRLRAAELLLLAQTLHGGEPAAIARAGEILQGVAAQPKLEPALLRGRALLAVAKGRSREAEGLLSTANSAESQLVLGLARLSDSKATAAVEPLRKYVAARPKELAGHYLLGKALAVGSPVQARAEFELVRAQNPTHGGAAVALARLEETPEKRLAAARALIDKKPKEIGRTELGDLSLLLGESAQAIGHTSEAKDAFQRAITQDNHLLAAHLALGEALLYEGKNSQALERMKAAGPALEGSPSGKFGLGGALLATGQTAQGLALVNAAATERPGDAREPYWKGFASTLEQPSDWTAAEQSYREAIKRDPKFLPASLQLAALLQQHGKAEDSLAVLRAAEEAGAPLPVLQLAWGEALLVAKEPSKAEEAFRKALAADATLISAHLGIASALEAENKLAEAKASLESAIKAAPAAPGLRERLARICLKLGENTDALSHYQEEIQAGNSTPQLRLALARTALDLGNVELAQGEAKKVLDEFPRNAEAAYTMARVYEAKNETGAALQEYRHATTWENLPAYSLGYGRLLAKIGKEHEALLALEAASSLADGRMERGRIYYRRGELESALADFQATSKLDPTAAEPHILEGLCLDKLGQPAKAEEAWREALRADPDVPEPHYRLGRQEMDRGKPALAIDHFRKAAAKAPQGAPWQAELYFQLGQAELLTGSKTAAVVAFKKYLELAPQDAPARPEATHQIAHLTGKK